MNISDVQMGDILVHEDGGEYVVVENSDGKVAYAWVVSGSKPFTASETFDQIYHWCSRIVRGGCSMVVTPYARFEFGDMVKGAYSGRTGVIVSVDNGGDNVAVVWAVKYPTDFAPVQIHRSVLRHA